MTSWKHYLFLIDQFPQVSFSLHFISIWFLFHNITDRIQNHQRSPHLPVLPNPRNMCLHLSLHFEKSWHFFFLSLGCLPLWAVVTLCYSGFPSNSLVASSQIPFCAHPSLLASKYWSTSEPCHVLMPFLIHTLFYVHVSSSDLKVEFQTHVFIIIYIRSQWSFYKWSNSKYFQLWSWKYLWFHKS